MKAALFDMDGTLIDTKGYIIGKINETLEEIGLEPRSEEEWIRDIRDGIGMRAYMREKGMDDKYGEFKQEYIRNYSEGLGEIGLVDGIEEMLEKLSMQGIKTGIYTLAFKPIMDSVVERFGLEMDAYVSKDDVEKPKPAPEQVILLSKKLQVKPRDCVAIGDMGCDVIAGKAAGTRTAGVLTGFGTRKEFEEVGTDWVLESASQVAGLRAGQEEALQTERSAQGS